MHQHLGCFIKKKKFKVPRNYLNVKLIQKNCCKKYTTSKSRKITTFCRIFSNNIKVVEIQIQKIQKTEIANIILNFQNEIKLIVDLESE